MPLGCLLIVIASSFTVVASLFDPGSDEAYCHQFVYSKSFAEGFPATARAS